MATRAFIHCSRTRLLLAVWCWFGAVIASYGGPVAFGEITTSYHGGSESELRETTDGSDIGRNGWSVAPNTDQRQSAIFRPTTPIEADGMDITLCFLSGRPNTFFGEFQLSSTSDPQPALNGRWEPLTPVRMSATGPNLTLLENGHMAADGTAADAVFQVTVRIPGKPVTGLRVDVFPTEAARGKQGRHVAANATGDFVLTEFRVEAATPRTTNIARGRPVRASHKLWGNFTPDALTDGLPGTFAHALQPDLGAAFFFEVDLGAVRPIDHIALRNRGDGTVPERLSHVILELSDDPLDAGGKPAWKGVARSDSTHSGPGEVDIIRAGNGTGKFAGRWLRISSNSRIAFSPQIAEVEVYEPLPLGIATARADDTPLSSSGPFQIPAGSRWLSVGMKPVHSGLPDDLAIRWRLRGHHADWQLGANFLAEGPCPPAGSYLFEAQVRHSDREWDSTALAIPVLVHGYFWQNRAFQFAIGGAAILAVIGLVRQITRRRLARRMAALESQANLDEERARIARDMHDEVGARLSQLAILQDIFAREHPLPDGARKSMQQLAQTTRQAVASLDEVVWAVNPRNDTLPSLAGYLEHSATGYLGSVDIACRLDAPFEWPPIEIRAQVRHDLVLAFREALQNVLKHAGANEVTLTLRLDAPTFVVILADNGRGLPILPEGTGKDGLNNMRARLARIGGTCEVRPRPNGGTEVEMRVPLGAAAQHPDRDR